jgi:hypothetical protein
MTQPRSLRVSVGVPTHNSAPHIEHSLGRLRQQLVDCGGAWSVDLIVCVNGPRGASETASAVARFARTCEPVPCELFQSKYPGKNSAMNAILGRLRARISPPDLVFFFDDDVRLSRGMLRRNIEALLEHEASHGPGPLLVGAALRVAPLSLLDARRRHPRAPHRALRAWLQHQVFAFPYREDAPVPRFCEGMALGARLEHFPPLPASSTGIGDDTFLSNTFALLGREKMEKTGASSLLKPPGSVGWVLLSDDLETWRAQQIRIHLGIELCWRHFEADRPFLASFFSWPFAFTPDARLPFRPRGLVDTARHRLYMMLHEQNRARALELLREGRVPAWCSGEIERDVGP